MSVIALVIVIALLIPIVAIVVDFISGRGKWPRWFSSVVRASERFDRWLDLHGAMQRMDTGESDDGFFGASEAGSDSLLGELEQMVRGGDRPRRRRPASSPSSAA